MKKIIPIICLILSIAFIIAIPSIPNVFYGTVSYSDDSEMILTGHEISASIGDWDLGIIGHVGVDNLYEIMLDPQGHSGEIVFYVGGVQTEETAEYNMGEFTELDLTIEEVPTNYVCGNQIQEPGEQCDGTDLGIGTCENVLGIPFATGDLGCTEYCTFDFENCSAPYCGDGLCNSGETCTDCSQDCGACSSSSSSSSSGGGGGGGGGGSSSSSSSSSGGGENEIINLGFEDETINLEESEEETETQDDVKPQITGGFIGFVKSGIGIGIIIAIVIIIAGIVVMNIANKGKKIKKK